MTKNKHLIFFFLAASFAVGVISCTPKYDVEGTCKNVALATIIGSDSVRSGAIVDGLKITLVDYRFLPGSKAVRTTTTFGDGVYEAPTSMNLSYQMDEFGESGVGVAVLFTPEDSSIEPFSVEFMNNALIENGTDTLTDLMAKVDNFGKIISTFPNSTWEYGNTVYYIDTTKYDSIKVTINKTVTPSGIVRDTIYDTIHVEIYDTMGIYQQTQVEISFNRDETTLANLGHYKYDYIVRTKGDSVTPAQDIDSLCVHKDYDMRWCFSSIITARQFNLFTIAETDDKERLSFNMFKYAAGESVIVNTDYTYTFKK